MNKRKIKKQARYLTAVMFAVVVMLFTVPAEAALLKTTVIDMAPGKTYDITDSDYSTQYTISKSGDYWLKGSSEHAFVRITGGKDVKLHLMDGLIINTSMYSYVGDAVAAIIVEDFDGTVTLCTEPGATVQMSGYLSWPGICKNGLKTKLVFMTADTSNEGVAKIYSTSTHFKSAPGIGSSWGGGHPFGNVVFESGKWYVGGSSAAAIGSSEGNDADGITINGGYIEVAHFNSQASQPCGPGIGVTGYGGTLKNLVINGGYVRAYGEEMIGWSNCAPGIGAGYGGSIDTIIINGGKVRAYAGRHDNSSSKGGCSGIGVAGDDAYRTSAGNAIIINGGDIEGYGGGIGDNGGFAGIGGSKVKKVEINGGTVKGEGNKCEEGILGGTVIIRGGAVTGKGGDSYSELYGSVVHHHGHGIRAVGDIRISGGVVTAVRKDLKGGNKDMLAGGKIIITGGSVDSAENNKTPVNESDQQLKESIFNLKNADGSIVTSEDVKTAEFSGLPYNYGIKDVYVDHGGKLYFWLPDGSAVTKASTDSANYYGNVTPGQKSDENTHDVFLGPGSDATICASKELSDAGSALIIFNEKKMEDLKVSAKYSGPGCTIEGFYLDDGFTNQLADADGNFLKNVKLNGKAVTDADGKWANLEMLGSDLKIFVKVSYTIKFDPNRPATASTEISGNVGDLTAIVGKKSALKQSNHYSLPGYNQSDSGWFTTEDGKGDSYKVDGNAEIDLSKYMDSRGYVTLYPQWIPKTYTVTLMPGDASSEGNQEYLQKNIKFDSTTTFDKAKMIGWTYPNYSFHGWMGRGFGSFYEDGEEFCNLCTLDANGDPTGAILTAEWVGNGEIRVTTTVDGEPKHVTDKMRITNDLTTPDSGLQLSDTGSDGHYRASLAGLPEDDYVLIMDSDDYTIPADKQKVEDLSDTSAVSVVLDYYTVSIIKDPAQDDMINNVVISGEGLIVPGKEDAMVAIDNGELAIETIMNKGYHFDGYSVAGVEPGWEKDRSVANQGITVRGEAELMAHAEPNLCHIKFDPNSKTEFKGEMEIQDVLFSQTQKLFANDYERPGATFAGWNTKADGSGASFDDCDDIDETAWDSMGWPEDDGTVTLYAQWDLTEYNINYDLNGGHLPDGKKNPATYTVESPDITLVDPLWSDDEFVFFGWVGTDCSNPDEKIVIPTGSIGDRNYKAEWKEVLYSVMFDTDGGTQIATQTLKVHKKATKPDDPEKEHFTFGGWYADKDLTTKFDFSKEITEDTIIHAKWNSIPHKITYDLNGGTLDGKTGKIVVDANEGDVITIMDAPEKEGYVFNYWKGSKYYPGDDYKVEEDHTLTAVWKKDRGSGEGGNSENGGNSGKDKHRGVNTGDDSSLPLWIILMGGAAAGLAGMLYRRRRHRV